LRTVTSPGTDLTPGLSQIMSVENQET
jgi:hypothetical protein